MSDGEFLDGFVPLSQLRPTVAVQGHFISIIPVADDMSTRLPRAIVLRPLTKGKDAG